MKYLKHDSDIRILKNVSEENDYFAFRRKYDQWVTVAINQCSVVAVENNPIFSSIKMKEFGIVDTEETNYSNMECVGDSGLFLRFPINVTAVTMPTRYTAFRGMLERAGLGGNTLTNYVRYRKKEVLPVELKAKWLSTGMSLYGSDTKILIRDEKVTAMLSDDYAILPVYDLVPILEEKCKEIYPDMKFSSGYVTHEYFTCEYHLHDDATDNAFKNLLVDIKAVDESARVSCGIIFVTSDVGLSRACAYPTLLLSNKTIRFGRGISLLHKGGNDLESFEKVIQSVSSIFDEAEERVEKLGNTDIPDIKSVVEQIVEEYKGIFAKKGFGCHSCRDDK